jgi:hypothetical protein
MAVSAGQASSQVQRAWRPAKVTNIAHLHRTKRKDPTRVATGFLGWVKPSDQLVVDDEDSITQGKTRRIKAVKFAAVSKFDPQAEDPSAGRPSGYIRDRKAAADEYPQGQWEKEPQKSRSERIGQVRELQVEGGDPRWHLYYSMPKSKYLRLNSETGAEDYGYAAGTAASLTDLAQSAERIACNQLRNEW